MRAACLFCKLHFGGELRFVLRASCLYMMAEPSEFCILELRYFTTDSFIVKAEKESFYYISGDKSARKLWEKEVGTDFLTDFYNMVSGKEKVTLSMQEVFDSTRQTLKIQELCIWRAALCPCQQKAPAQAGAFCN